MKRTMSVLGLVPVQGELARWVLTELWKQGGPTVKEILSDPQGS